VLPDEREDLERLAQYIIRNPFAVEKMQVSAPNQANPDGSVIYRPGLNPKVQRNFEVFSPCDFIAAITQHIPDKSFQLVRYYGGYSNKMHGQRDKRAAEEAKAADNGVVDRDTALAAGIDVFVVPHDRDGGGRVDAVETVEEKDVTAVLKITGGISLVAQAAEYAGGFGCHLEGERHAVATGLAGGVFRRFDQARAAGGNRGDGHEGISTVNLGFVIAD